MPVAHFLGDESMTLRIGVILAGILAFTCSVSAQLTTPADRAELRPADATRAKEEKLRRAEKRAAQLGLIARQPLPKIPTPHLRVPIRATGWLHVKFRDDVRARTGNGLLQSTAGHDLRDLQRTIEEFGATMRPLIRIDDSILVGLEERAAMLSGRAQPDLRGMVAIKPPRGNLLELAQLINDHPSVEWLMIDTELEASFGGDLTGACCVDVICQEDFTPEECVTAGGVYLGDDTDCSPDPCTGTEACCTNDPEGDTLGCLDLLPDECLTICGLPQGPFSLCDVDEFECPDTGQCCLPDNTDCLDVTEGDCALVGGTFRGSNTLCCQPFACEPDCGDPTLQDCSDPSEGTPFCNEEECCEFVCEFDPGCCDLEVEGSRGWDIICATYAVQFCGDTPLPCSSPFTGSCFEVHVLPGCQPGGSDGDSCCEIVCEVEPFCCESGWPQFCVDLAIELCLDGTEPSDDTDFFLEQGWLRPESYDGQEGDVDDLDLTFPAPNFPGYDGAGYNLGNVSPDSDEDGDGIKDNDDDSDENDFGGLYGLSRELWYDFGIGLGENFGGGSGDDDDSFGNPNGGGGGGNTVEKWKDLPFNPAGRGVKIAVIEAAYYEDHEDLNVTPEPGATMIITESLTFPNHATACLGIINAKDNDDGVVGIVPKAKGHFFPFFTAEDGSRWVEAFIQCYNTLGPGDVVSCSFGPIGGLDTHANLNVNQQYHTLMRLGSDLGILTCVSAGNDCWNLDNSVDLGDSGAVVVGAGSPGAPFYRLAFSNHFQAVPSPVAGNQVHVQAWGDATTTIGGAGDLYKPENDENQSYTNSFNGTSSAAPQVAGVAAALQGLAQQFYGIPLPVSQLRNRVLTRGWPQGFPYGFDDGAIDCALDRDPDEGPNQIGNYTRPRDAGAFLLIDDEVGFADSPSLEDLRILWGRHEFGNVFSVKGLDGSHLVVSSLPVKRWDDNPPYPAPDGDARYWMTTQATDVRVIARADKEDTPNPTNATITVQGLHPETIAFTVIEAYNWDSRHWDFLDFSFLGDTSEGIGFSLQTFIGYLAPYMRRLEMRVRITTYGLGGGPGGIGLPGTTVASFHSRFDWIDVTFGTGFGTGTGDGAGGGLGF
jgi:hypothetical protein